MTDASFSVILSMVVPIAIDTIMKNLELSEKEAIIEFYSSKVYEALSVEELKAWHYGPASLCEIFRQERETGTFDLSEEAC